MANVLSDTERALVDAYWRAANYLSVGQILSDCRHLRLPGAAQPVKLTWTSVEFPVIDRGRAIIKKSFSAARSIAFGVLPQNSFGYNSNAYPEVDGAGRPEARR
jgi:hypothetical protein